MIAEECESRSQVRLLFAKSQYLSYKDNMKTKIQTGFTLIELLITAAILVVVLAFAVPSFESII